MWGDVAEWLNRFALADDVAEARAMFEDMVAAGDMWAMAIREDKLRAHRQPSHAAHGFRGVSERL